MTTCKDLELSLSLHAAGALEPDEVARLEAHLAGCAGCRAELAATAKVLSLARLPPPSGAEKAAAATLPKDALSELHRREGRTSTWKRAAAGFLAAAAVLVAVLAPALLGRKAALPPAATGAGAAAEATWQEPDLDTLWSDAGVLELEGSASASSDVADAAVASLDL